MNLLNPLLAARALGIDASTPAWQEVRRYREGGHELLMLVDGPQDDLERAARTRAIERYPLRVDLRCLGCGETLDDDQIVCGYHPEAGVERVPEDNDGGADGCPPAATRHVLAGCLVLELATMGGFRYGAPPPDRDETRWRAGGFAGDEDYPGADVYALAHRVMEFVLGISMIRDPEELSNEQTPDEIHERAVDLAIDLICDEEHSIAEIAAGAVAWLLHTYAGGRNRGESVRSVGWAIARARRICSAVGLRFPKER